MVGVRHMVNPLCVDRSAYLQPQTFLKYSDLGSEQRAFLCTCDSQRTLRPRINLLRRRFGLVYLGLAAMLHKSASRSCGPARGPGTTCFLHSGSRLVASVFSPSVLLSKLHKKGLGILLTAQFSDFRIHWNQEMRGCVVCRAWHT